MLRWDMPSGGSAAHSNFDSSVYLRMQVSHGLPGSSAELTSIEGMRKARAANNAARKRSKAGKVVVRSRPVVSASSLSKHLGLQKFADDVGQLSNPAQSALPEEGQQLSHQQAALVVSSAGGSAGGSAGPASDSVRAAGHQTGSDVQLSVTAGSMRASASLTSAAAPVQRLFGTGPPAGVSAPSRAPASRAPSTGPTAASTNDSAVATSIAQTALDGLSPGSLHSMCVALLAQQVQVPAEVVTAPVFEQPRPFVLPPRTSGLAAVAVGRAQKRARLSTDEDPGYEPSAEVCNHFADHSV